MTDFDRYIVQGEPDKSEKPSEYLLKTAEQHIEGDITISEVKTLIDSYYESKGVRIDSEHEGQFRQKNITKKE